MELTDLKVVGILVNGCDDYSSYEYGDNIDAIVSYNDNIANIRINSYEVVVSIISKNNSNDFELIVSDFTRWDIEDVRDYVFEKFESYLKTPNNSESEEI